MAITKTRKFGGKVYDLDNVYVSKRKALSDAAWYRKGSKQFLARVVQAPSGYALYIRVGKSK